MFALRDREYYIMMKEASVHGKIERVLLASTSEAVNSQVMMRRDG